MCSRRLLAFLALYPLACSSVAAQRRNVLDEAQELNTASRFGRLDVASQMAAPEAQQTFLERRRTWGSQIRVLDVQVSHVQVKDSDNAEVTIQVDWTRADEGLLRSTVLCQQWHSEDRGPWRLESERQVQGDRGLFGEKVLTRRMAPVNDTQFETRSLGTVE
jgi:hypothetical protein